ncbi:catalase [Shewanella schlegeliana]|uniref:Catalase n=1 Tax=Shewanella schlegeliana TaxID=190308 RepID=A0ABS1T399_9GAMM|nr:catalase [Shewanella schlegeliana]MBL4915271.1 catalase [Shewanella schlegeliana]MCL1111218.1 catalase [Shewanella schlegeliana]GIU34144.1 catalase [Shewanella schlegeliana]
MEIVKKAGLALSLSLVVVNAQADTLTRDNGAPVGDNQNSITAGSNGSVLLQDVQLIQKLQRFARERIPERVVHARGTGVHGEFIASSDLSELTQAAPFADKGKITPVFVRFSTVIHSKGSPETLRDPRGFATRFYSDQGNWDLVGNNLPVFFIRDAIKFPDMVHSLKPSPITNLQDPNRFFDFFSHEATATNMLTWVYTNLGTPASYRKMDGWGVHAYKFINDEHQVKYVKFHWKSQQGVEGLRPDEVIKTQGQNFNHLTDDLYSEINKGNFPKWDLMVKVLNPEDLNKFDYNPLDATKMWLDVPETKVGTMTLNRVPANFFQETEQAAFAPSNLIPGIEPSEDKLLQGRIFSYADTQLYRLGANLSQLPINQPNVAVANHNQEGAANYGHTSSDVNYQPSTKLPLAEDHRYRAVQTPLSGTVQQAVIAKQDNFTQAGVLYRSLTKQDKRDLITNLSADLGKVTDSHVKHQMLSYFYQADKDFGKGLTQAVAGDLNEVKKRANM